MGSGAWEAAAAEAAAAA
uniref:Uncharacterized protein n=1 Tax=Arundo donax TaxID=35708 RepID=A0A0A9GXN0_ARUDO